MRSSPARTQARKASHQAGHRGALGEPAWVSGLVVVLGSLCMSEAASRPPSVPSVLRSPSPPHPPQPSPEAKPTAEGPKRDPPVQKTSQHPSALSPPTLPSLSSFRLRPFSHLFIFLFPSASSSSSQGAHTNSLVGTAGKPPKKDNLPFCPSPFKANFCLFIYLSRRPFPE